MDELRISFQKYSKKILILILSSLADIYTIIGKYYHDKG